MIVKTGKTEKSGLVTIEHGLGTRPRSVLLHGSGSAVWRIEAETFTANSDSGFEWMARA